MELTVNGRRYVVGPEPSETLSDTLRESLHLTGTKIACGRGECGACTVLLDGEPVYACLTLTISCEGASITTVEGLAPSGELHPIQQAFIEHDAVQCGFCTPGQLMAAAALLARVADPDDDMIRRSMSGNLCRCGTYPKIAAAIRSAASTMRGADAG